MTLDFPVNVYTPGLLTAPVTSTKISGSAIVMGVISTGALIWVFPRATINIDNRSSTNPMISSERF
jgi:hypothetical protein